MLRTLFAATVAVGLLLPTGAVQADPGSPPHRSPETTTQELTAQATSTAAMINHVDARITRLTGRIRVAALTRLDLHRKRDAPRKQADRIKVHTVVSTPTGLVIGPEHTLDLDGKSKVRKGTVIGIDRRTGELKAAILLTAAQRNALRALRRSGLSRSDTARHVRVLVRQHQDTSKATTAFESIGSAGARARYRGRALAVPSPAAVRALGASGSVLISNTTAAPLLLMAGPTSCMYDSLYDDAEISGSDAGSQLGTLNGLLLDPGTSVSVPVQSDHNSLNGQEDNGGGTQVLADYQEYQDYAMHDAASAGEGDLPEWELPESDNEDNPDAELTTELVEFTIDTVRNLLNATGQWMRLLSWARDADELTEAEVEAFEAGVEAVDVGVDVVLGPVLGIVTGLFDLFMNGCDSHDGYIVVGAMDQYHPWRQFAQVYDWGKANPTIPTKSSTNYGSLSNGLKVSASQGAPTDSASAGNLPLVAGTTSMFTFRTAAVAANQPATVSLEAGTRRVHCGLPDAPALNSALAATGAQSYQPFTPAGQWYGLAGGSSPVAPANYLIGDHFIPPSQPSQSVRYSSDGHTWNSVDVPAGQGWVDLPAVPTMKWVACDVQAPELFVGGAGTARVLLAGTRVPSNVVAGPDYASNTFAVTSVTPATADPIGGDPMTITGTGFQPGAQVTFQDDPLGPLPATTTYVSSQALSVTIPAGLIDSTATIKVTNPNGKSASWSGQFLYQCARTGCRHS